MQGAPPAARRPFLARGCRDAPAESAV